MKSSIETFKTSSVRVFLLIGSVNTLIGYSIFGLEYEAFEMNYGALLIVAYIFGILVSYSDHQRVTCKSKSKRHQPFALIFVTIESFMVQRSWMFKS